MNEVVLKILIGIGALAGAAAGIAALVGVAMLYMYLHDVMTEVWRWSSKGAGLALFAGTFAAAVGAVAGGACMESILDWIRRYARKQQS